MLNNILFVFYLMNVLMTLRENVLRTFLEYRYVIYDILMSTYLGYNYKQTFN